MNLEQLERLHETDRLYEQEKGHPPEAIQELRELVSRIFEVNGELRVKGGGLAIKVPGLKKVPPDIRAGLEKKWHILVDLLERTSEKRDRAFNSEDPTDWKEFRRILIEWCSLGVSPIPLISVGEDGVEFAWVFELRGGGISGHRSDGKASLAWSEERGFELWGADSIVN